MNGYYNLFYNEDRELYYKEQEELAHKRALAMNKKRIQAKRKKITSDILHEFLKIAVSCMACVGVFCMMSTAYSAVNKNVKDTTKDKVQQDYVSLEINPYYINHAYSIADFPTLDWDAIKRAYPLSEQDKYIVTCIVVGEAGEDKAPDKLVHLVVQTIYHHMVEEGDLSKVRTFFDGYIEQSEVPVHTWDRCAKYVEMVFNDGIMAIDDTPYYFYNPSAMPEGSGTPFHETQRFITEEFGVRFFGKWEDK